jgi:hypothetical protein
LEAGDDYFKALIKSKQSSIASLMKYLNPQRDQAVLECFNDMSNPRLYWYILYFVILAFFHYLTISHNSIAKLNEHIRAHLSRPGVQDRIHRRMKRAVARKFTYDFVKNEALQQGIDIESLRNHQQLENTSPQSTNISFLVSRDDKKKGSADICRGDHFEISGTIGKLIQGIRASKKGPKAYKEFCDEELKGTDVKDLCIGAK